MVSESIWKARGRLDYARAELALFIKTARVEEDFPEHPCIRALAWCEKADEALAAGLEPRYMPPAAHPCLVRFSFYEAPETAWITARNCPLGCGRTCQRTLFATPEGGKPW